MIQGAMYLVEFESECGMPFLNVGQPPKNFSSVGVVLWAAYFNVR